MESSVLLSSRLTRRIHIPRFLHPAVRFHNHNVAVPAGYKVDVQLDAFVAVAKCDEGSGKDMAVCVIGGVEDIYVVHECYERHAGGA